jgi:hypothetical protein
VKPGADETLEIRRRRQRVPHAERPPWGDIAYHFLIGPSGKIYEGRSPRYVDDTGTDYDPKGTTSSACSATSASRSRPTPRGDPRDCFCADRLPRLGLSPPTSACTSRWPPPTCPKNGEAWLKAEARPDPQAYLKAGGRKNWGNRRNPAPERSRGRPVDPDPPAGGSRL